MRKGRIRENLDLIVLTSIISMIGSLSLGYANDIMFAGNEVSYDNSVSGLNSVTVQGALDELCTAADFSDRVSTLEGKTTTLEGYFQNSPKGYFDGQWIRVKPTTEGGFEIKSSSGTNASQLYRGSNGRTYLISYDSTGVWENWGPLDIRGNPVYINSVDMSTRYSTNFNVSVGTGSIYVYSVGNVVTVKIQGVNPGTITAATTVANVAAGYRPPTTVYFTDGNNNGITADITTAGDIRIGKSGSGKTLYGSVTYVKWN